MHEQLCISAPLGQQCHRAQHIAFTSYPSLLQVSDQVSEDQPSSSAMHDHLQTSAVPFSQLLSETGEFLELLVRPTQEREMYATQDRDVFVVNQLDTVRSLISMRIVCKRVSAPDTETHTLVHA